MKLNNFLLAIIAACCLFSLAGCQINVVVVDKANVSYLEDYSTNDTQTFDAESIGVMP